MIEVLAAAVQALGEIKEVKISTMEYKTVLYADELAFLMQDPALSDLLDVFAESSGYKVNTSKSALMGLNITRGD